MMDFNERVIPGVSSNFMFKEALARYEFAAKYIKPGMKILDLGSGTGYGSGFLGSLGAKVTGVDINREAVEFSKRKYGGRNVKFQKGNILDLKFKDESFDAIVSFEVIEHLDKPQKFLKDINRFLKKDSVLILSTPNASVVSPKGGVASPYHVKEFNFKELNMLLKNEFNKVDIFGQTKSKKALSSWADFMDSQKARETVAKNDKFGIRKLIPKSFKEWVWKYLGSFFGRGTQEDVETKDFPIGKESVRLAYYFVVVCQKSQ